MSVLSSSLFQNLFSTEEMRDIFSDRNQVQKWIEAEIALAEAEAELGVIPSEAAAEIRKKGKVELFSIDEMKKGILSTWHPLISMIRQFEGLCDRPYGEYIHWGATTQDIMDTGLMLQIGEALQAVERDLDKLLAIAKSLARKHKHTIMSGRTHGQQGLPLTFGYKAAVWVDEISRHMVRLQEIKAKTNTGNLSGGVGTLASLGENAVEVRERFFAKLGLTNPKVTWHAARDRLSETVFLLAMIGSTFGKIANEIVQLQKTEVGELEEPFYHGKVGSSTMPQKRNPMACETVVAINSFLRQQTALITQSMMMENERDLRVWMIEWEVIPTSFKYVSAVLKHMEWVLRDLKVNEKQMEANLKLSKGLIMSEAVFMKLSQFVGHQKAHELVYDLAMSSYEKGILLADELKSSKEIRSHLTDKEIDELLSTKNYIGLSAYFIDKALS